MFASATLDLNDETFIIHIALFASSDLDVKVYPFCIAQIVSLKADEALISVFSKYTNFADVFSKNLAAKPLEHCNIIGELTCLVFVIWFTESENSP